MKQNNNAAYGFGFTGVFEAMCDWIEFKLESKAVTRARRSVSKGRSVTGRKISTRNSSLAVMENNVARQL